MRRITNEKDLIFSLDKLGIRNIYFEDYANIEKIRIEKEVNQIIAMHSAGLVNINFCKKGTKIIELLPFNYQYASFYMHANLCEREYKYYICKPDNRLWRKCPIMEKFYVDIENIKEFILKN